MTRTVSEPTTRVVGPLKRIDQRDELHTQAAMGNLGKGIQERWISESVDPFRRIFYPDRRPQNAPMRSWRSVADGPLNPNRTEVKNPRRMSELIKGGGGGRSERGRHPTRAPAHHATEDAPLPAAPAGRGRRPLSRVPRRGSAQARQQANHPPGAFREQAGRIETARRALGNFR